MIDKAIGLLRADLILDPDEIIFDEKTGDIKVSTDLFDSYSYGMYLNIMFTDEGSDIIHQYKMIDKNDDYIIMEYIGG